MYFQKLYVLFSENKLNHGDVNLVISVHVMLVWTCFVTIFDFFLDSEHMHVSGE